MAEGRYTKAYISALETGAAKPSMAALNFLAGRLGTTAAVLLVDPDTAWTRLEADLRLASGDALGAADVYSKLLDSGPDPGDRAELLLALAEASCRIDRPLEAIRAAAEAVELFTILGRPAERAQATYWLGLAQHLQDNADEARGLLAALLADLRAGLSVAADFELKVLVGLAATETYRGSHQAAVGYLEEARSLSADLDDRRRGIVLTTLANGYVEAGDHEAAIRNGMQALTLLRAAEADFDVAVLENNLAVAYLAIGSTDRAAQLVAEAQTIGRRHHDDRLLAHLADTEAQVALATGDAPRAIALAEVAIERAEAVGGSKAAVDFVDDPCPGPSRGWRCRRGPRRLRPRRRVGPGACTGAAPARGPGSVGRRTRCGRTAFRGVCRRPRGARGRRSDRRPDSGGRDAARLTATSVS